MRRPRRAGPVWIGAAGAAGLLLAFAAGGFWWSRRPQPESGPRVSAPGGLDDDRPGVVAGPLFFLAAPVSNRADRTGKTRARAGSRRAPDPPPGGSCS